MGRHADRRLYARRSRRQGRPAYLSAARLQAFGARRGMVAAGAAKLKSSVGSATALDGKHLDSRRAATQARLPQRFDRESRLELHVAQQVGRHQQIPADLLAMLLQPRRHVHGIAEIGKLAPRAAALADHAVTGMQASPETWHHAEPQPEGI